MERKLVTVAVDGSAEFTTLTAAAAAQVRSLHHLPDFAHMKTDMNLS